MGQTNQKEKMTIDENIRIALENADEAQAFNEDAFKKILIQENGEALRRIYISNNKTNEAMRQLAKAIDAINSRLKPL
jgi:hypothetical protein